MGVTVDVTVDVRVLNFKSVREGEARDVRVAKEEKECIEVINRVHEWRPRETPAVACLDGHASLRAEGAPIPDDVRLIQDAPVQKTDTVEKVCGPRCSPSRKRTITKSWTLTNKFVCMCFFPSR